LTTLHEVYVRNPDVQNRGQEQEAKPVWTSPWKLVGWLVYLWLFFSIVDDMKFVDEMKIVDDMTFEVDEDLGKQLQNEFILKQLIDLAANLDLADEVGR
jgi:hypothetical protein